MKKIYLPILAICLCFSSMCARCLAYEAPEHNKLLKDILLGNENYSRDTDVAKPITNNAIEAMDDACFLTMDQVLNTTGMSQLGFLKDTIHVPDLPHSVDEISYNYVSTKHHFTHRGWEFPYPDKDSKICNWPIRKQILLSTVTKLYGFSTKTKFFLNDDEKVSGNWYSTNLLWHIEYSDQCDCLSALIYYIHLIGDCEDTSDKWQIELNEPLHNAHDKNKSIIYDLIGTRAGGKRSRLDVLFPSKENTVYLRSLKNELKKIADRASDIVNSDQGVNTDKEVEDYRQCARDVIDQLKYYIPKMLRNEPYFQKVFYR